MVGLVHVGDDHGVGQCQWWVGEWVVRRRGLGMCVMGKYVDHVLLFHMVGWVLLRGTGGS